jgi:hypothetical protein
MMNNNFESNQIFQLQRLLAAQNAQRGMQGHSLDTTAMNPAASGGNPLLDQYLLGNRMAMAHQPSALGLAAAGMNRLPSHNYGMIQMMLMNNEREQRDRFILAERERALLTERIAQQEMLLHNNDRSIKRLHESLDHDPNSEAQHDPSKHQEEYNEEEEEEYNEEEEDYNAEAEEAPAPAAARSKKRVKKPRQPKKKQDTRWLSSYQELKDYKDEYGDCIVPRGFPLNPRLASWVAEQRKQYKLLKDGKNSSITPKRIELLDDLEFAWNAQEAAWERHINDLKKFRDDYGDCLVPLNHPKYPKLGLWVKEQRRHYTLMKQDKPSHMTDERARALDDVGFCWDTHEAVWGERLRELCHYKATYGDCIVPTNYSANPKLGTWVHHQRRQYKKYKEGKPCHITAERIRALESIGFVWYPRERSRYTDAASSSGSDTESDSELNDLDLRPSKRQRS